jgi:hypothetical protein
MLILCGTAVYVLHDVIISSHKADLGGFYTVGCMYSTLQLTMYYFVFQMMNLIAVVLSYYEIHPITRDWLSLIKKESSTICWAYSHLLI